MSYEIRVERLLTTTPEVAFHQWVSPEGRKRWFTGEQSDWVADAEVDLRVGGRFWTTWGPIGGTTWREEGTFVEVDQPTRLVYGSLTTPPLADVGNVAAFAASDLAASLTGTNSTSAWQR